MQSIEFEPNAFVELREWLAFDRKISRRILDLIKD